MDTKDYFLNPQTASQRKYEALKAFYLSDCSADNTAKRFGFSPLYFKKIRFEFSKNLREKVDPFFSEKKTGPKRRLTNDETINIIVSLRKQNYSVGDIKVVLDAQDKIISLDTIDKILKSEGFAPLLKRTRKERLSIQLPKKLDVPRCMKLKIADEEFTTETAAGPLIFLPILEKLGIIEAIKKCDFPKTKDIDDLPSVLSFLALKLMGYKRWSHDTRWNMDRTLGFFSFLNVLPKAGTLSTYSYRTTRSSIRKLLLQLCRIFKDDEKEEGEFNLDFKAIPHWGDASILEKNWSGSRNKSIKSLLALIVQDPSTGNLSYTNAEIKHRQQNEAVFDFVDFWTDSRARSPKMLIFDSKFTTYKNLNKLDKSPVKIKFLTLRRRGKKLISEVKNLSSSSWQKIKVKRAGNKEQLVRVYDGFCNLSGYEGKVRQVILTDHGRKHPTFLITNDFDLKAGKLVEKYARRWLVEDDIAEQIMFFSLNHPSSSIVVKVDFDLAISLLAHNLYRRLANELTGFENCTAMTINRKFLENGAHIKIEGNSVLVTLKKKSHLPLLFEIPWMKETTRLSWMGLDIKFYAGTTS